MKKLICLILTVVLLLGTLSSTGIVSIAANEENTVITVFDNEAAASQIVMGEAVQKYILGDADGDGIVNPKDSIVLKRYLVGSLYEINRAAADTNGDGVLNSKDSLFLKFILIGKIEVNTLSFYAAASASGNTAHYDEIENAAAVSADGTMLTAKIIPEELKDGYNASDYRYAGIVYKADSKAAKGAVYASADSPVKTEYLVYADESYHVKMVDLSENAGWNGDISSISYDFLTDCSSGDTVYVDSFILTNSIEALEAHATERLQIRNYNELLAADGSSGSVSDTDSFSIVFNSEESLVDIGAPNNTTYSFNTYASCLELVVAGDRIDPQVYLDLSTYNLSADEYKYVTYIYKTRTDSLYERKGEIFFCAGNVAGPTGGCSYQFKLAADGNLYAVTVDASSLKNSYNKTYWNGKVHGLRLDFFQDATVGESVFVKAVVLSKSAAAAETTAAMLTGKQGVGTLDAKASMDYLYKVYSKDTSGTEYIENVDGALAFRFTGGTVDRFTKEHLATRLGKFITRNVGTIPEVEVLDGYEALYDSYVDTEKADGYVTYKVQVEDNFFILFRKTEYNMKKIILDHDLGPDCDDAAAICIAVKAHMKGEINCLAITSCMNTSMSAYAGAAVPHYLGCNDIPFAYNNERSATGMNVRCCGTPATQYWNKQSAWPTIYYNTPLLREILANNGGERDILFITIGPLTTLYCLFNSPADQFSELNGRELWAANVSHYVCGGGNFSHLNDNEHNFQNDFEATNATVNTITEVPMTFVGANVAGTIMSGDPVLKNCSNDWVLRPYYYLQSWELYYCRQSWDLATVYYAVYGGAGMWQVKSGYDVKAWTNGETILSQPGTSSFIEPITSDSYVQGVFNETMQPYLN